MLDLIKNLLVVDPKKRFNASEALKHEWFTSSTEHLKIDNDVMDRLTKFKGVSKLKKAAMNMLVKMADQQQIEKLREQFTEIDIDGTGLINASELKVAIKQSNLNIPDSEIEDIINEIDYYGNQKINYTEFLVATLNIKEFLDDSKL